MFTFKLCDFLDLWIVGIDHVLKKKRIFNYNGAIPSMTVHVCSHIYSYYIRTVSFSFIQQSRIPTISISCSTFLLCWASWFVPRHLWIIYRNFSCIPKGNIWDKRSNRKTVHIKFFVSPFQLYMSLLTNAERLIFLKKAKPETANLKPV